MKLRIGFKGQLTTQNILNDLSFALKNGFNCLEVGVRRDEDFNLKSETIKQIRNISEKNNIALTVHPSPFLPISSPFQEVSRAGVKNVKKCIILANKLEANHLVLHSGYKEVAGPAVAENYRTLVKNLKEIVKFGRKYGIKIALENSDIHSGAMCIEAEDLLKVVDAVNGLKIVFDVGHANTTKVEPVKYFKKVKKFVINMHLHDNDGKADQHLLTGKGNVNFKELFRECKKSRYYGPFIFEVSPRENILKGKKMLVDLWNKI